MDAWDKTSSATEMKRVVVVEGLTRDIGAAGSSLTGVTAEDTFRAGPRGVVYGGGGALKAEGLKRAAQAGGEYMGVLPPAHWMFFGGHHKIGLYLGVISMQFRVFSYGQGTELAIFLGWRKFRLKFRIFLGCLKFLIFILG